MSSNAPSPSAAPDAEEELRNSASPDASEERETSTSARASPQPLDAEESRPKSSMDKPKRKFLLFFQKKYYEVDPSHVVFDMNKPFRVDSGEAAYKLHQCHSHATWFSSGVHSRHIIKLKFELDNKTVTGLYITFKIADEDSDDVCIIRALHKSIAKKFYESWVAEWSDEKRTNSKFKELIADEPPDESQISPDRARYKLAATPLKVLYERMKKLKIADDAPNAPAKKTKTKHAGKESAPPEADESADDAQSSAAQSSAAQSSAAQSSATAPSFSPVDAKVTISLAHLQHLLANQRQ